MCRVPFGELSREPPEPLVEHLGRAGVERGEGADHAGLALREHQVGVGDEMLAKGDQVRVVRLQRRVRALEAEPAAQDHRIRIAGSQMLEPVSYTHLRAHETVLDLVCRLLLEKKNKTKMPAIALHQLKHTLISIDRSHMDINTDTQTRNPPRTMIQQLPTHHTETRP